MMFQEDMPLIELLELQDLIDILNEEDLTKEQDTRLEEIVAKYQELGSIICKRCSSLGNCAGKRRNRKKMNAQTPPALRPRLVSSGIYGIRVMTFCRMTLHYFVLSLNICRIIINWRVLVCKLFRTTFGRPGYCGSNNGHERLPVVGGNSAAGPNDAVACRPENCSLKKGLHISRIPTGLYSA